ncbi:MAG: right-handed parallel beta-helix repeat-containing protein [Pseudonocardiaceae bacterium]
MNIRGLATVSALGLALAAGCAGPATPDAPIATPPRSLHTAPAAPPATVPCSGPAVQDVSTTDQLRAALVQAQPGAVIHLRDGSYPGRFEITTAATADRPITLCGSRAAILDGGPTDSGYTLHLRDADHWRLSGFTIHGGQKGLMIDSTRGALIEGLLIHEVGDEAVHLRTASSDNTVQANTIRRTGLRKAKFGEGIYIGSARSNWCTHSNCGPDRSDRNIIQANDIAETTAEAIDIKEGTSHGTLRGNIFSGAAMTAADSWVDIKGNNWTIADNIGTDAPEDGFQTHRILDGWGERNTFGNNTATLNADGYAINITKKDLGNTVSCTNHATNAADGLSNIPCQ